MPAPSVTRQDRTAQVAVEYDLHRSKRDAAKGQMDESADELNALVALDTTFEYTYEGLDITVHGSASSTSTLDEAGLRRALLEQTGGNRIWNKLVTKRVDPRKLQLLIEEGEIDADLVERFTTHERGKQYPKVSVKTSAKGQA